MLESIKDYIPSINKEGYLLILGFLLATLILFMMSNSLGWIGIILTIWCVLFFRDPDRVTPIGDELIISPGDGIIQAITKAKLPKELMDDSPEMTRISIFLSVFDVHVNRIPITGKIIGAHYNPGKFFNASLDKASEFNERQSLLIKTNNDIEIGVVQIAGLIARRIICNVKTNDDVIAGKRFGIIKFGSRVDIYLPSNIEPQVVKGQYVIGGETVLANLTANLPERLGEVR